MVRCLPPDAVANDPSRLTPTAIPNAVVALEIARPRVMGSISPRAIDRCKMRASSGPEADEAGRSRPCARRICGKITGEEAVVLKIPGIAAAVIIPGGGRRVPLQKRLVRALRQRRARRSHRERRPRSICPSLFMSACPWAAPSPATWMARPPIALPAVELAAPELQVEAVPPIRQGAAFDIGQSQKHFVARTASDIDQRRAQHWPRPLRHSCRKASGVLLATARGPGEGVDARHQ